MSQRDMSPYGVFGPGQPLFMTDQPGDRPSEFDPMPPTSRVPGPDPQRAELAGIVPAGEREQLEPQPSRPRASQRLLSRIDQIRMFEGPRGFAVRMTVYTRNLVSAFLMIGVASLMHVMFSDSPDAALVLVGRATLVSAAAVQVVAFLVSAFKPQLRRTLPAKVKLSLLGSVWCTFVIAVVVKLLGPSLSASPMLASVRTILVISMYLALLSGPLVTATLLIKLSELHRGDSTDEEHYRRLTRANDDLLR